MKGNYWEAEYEAAFLGALQEQGWQLTHGDKLPRQFTEPLLSDDLRAYLRSHYSDLTPNELERIEADLRLTSGATDYLSARAVAQLLQNGKAFPREDPAQPDLLLEYLDFAHPERNIFRAVNQFTMRERNAERRPDVLLFVNGIPLAIIELKNPAKSRATIFDAWQQIYVRYRRDIPSLLKYCLLACISDGGATRLGTPYTPYEHFYAWKKVENETEAASGVGEMQTLVQGAFAPSRLLAIVRDFVYFPDLAQGAQKETEIVCRYPQFFAVQKLYAHILQHLHEQGGDGKGGTYFGATGCGKTYTMLFLARCLLKHSGLAPTILVIVDREDLETQSGKLFESSTDFLGDGAIRSFSSREELQRELSTRQTGGVFITTIQKFCESMGVLSDRGNIICLSDEAHRSQLNVGEQLEIKDGSKGESAGAYVKYGFAQYLHHALPNATYVGFTGTPIEETVQVFGPVVDRYTMRQAVADGITVPLKYEARLARVMLDTAKAKEIEAYYSQCQEEGTKAQDVDKSRRAMSKLEVILGDEDRLARMAQDIVEHYEAFTAENPGQVIKAMIVSSTRQISYRLYQKIQRLRPAWFEPLRAADEAAFTTPVQKAELETRLPIPMVNLVATRGANDPAAMYELLGDKKHRQMLDREFKDPRSNFRIAMVVDMWITGFDVPELCILYNDKPLQRHTLIQTISRVNRTSPGKQYGLIVDYIGIREQMKKALKSYNDDEAPITDEKATHAVFVNELQTLRDLLHGFDAHDFLTGQPLERLQCLQAAAEFVLAQPDSNGVTFAALFKGHVLRLKTAYGILQPSGVLSKEETTWAQFFLAVQGIVAKTCSSDSGLSVETMNRQVETMVGEALQCTGVETVLNAQETEELFSEKFAQELNKVKLPHTKFQVLVKLLKRAIKDYGRTNLTRSKHFEELLQAQIDKYNSRDKLTFTNEVATETINAVLDILYRLRDDEKQFQQLGISYEEKAFFDILVEVRNTHQFEYPDDKCLVLAQKIKALIDNSSRYADWLNNENVKADLQAELTFLLYREGYPPQWDNVIFEKVMEQVRNYKTYQN